MALWVFDNDGTLYGDFGAGEQFQSIFNAYVTRELNILTESVSDEVKRLKKKHQTDFSLIAIMNEFGLDFDMVVERTYMQIDLDACGVPSNCSRTQNFLASLEGSKVVLTNNPSQYAKRVLEHMGINSCFEDIIGMQEVGFKLKPHENAFRLITERFPDHCEYIMVDDRVDNLTTAKALGWKTILCGEQTLPDVNDIGYKWAKSELKRAALENGHHYAYRFGAWKND